MGKTQYKTWTAQRVLRPKGVLRDIASCVWSVLLASCSVLAPLPPAPTATVAITLTVIADGQTQTFGLAAPMTVREALAQAGIAVGELDRLSLPPYTRLTAPATVTLIRVTETLETQEVAIPFSAEVIKSEGLPEGEQRLLQAGVNGVEHITYRTVFENGIQVSRDILKREVLTDTIPQITLVGAQASFTLVPLTGTLAYLNAGNAWIMRQNSGQRRPVTFSGDLDGRIFQLSPDGQRLLYTRALIAEPLQGTSAGTLTPTFNSLWAISVTTSLTNVQPLDLKVSNVLYAEWSPTQPNAAAYSTAEKIDRAPGWQANNDLWLATWGYDRRRQLVFTNTQILDTSSGGIYGWWGTGYAFSPNGAYIAYARTDSIGLVDLTTLAKTELASFTAYNTHSDWAWYPTLNWSSNSLFLYTVTHGLPSGLEAPEDSPVFNLTALSPRGLRVDLIPRVGMFANPIPSPIQPSNTPETPHRVAFLQAIEPANSANSRYRLGVMDRDGSNLRFVFPPEDQPGLSANAGYTWSPDGKLLAVIYEGNLWLVDPDTGVSQQLTGDGLSEHPTWGR